MMVVSVALLFVSYQILKGKKENKRCKFLIDQLHTINYQVEKLLVVDENVNIVTSELDDLSKQYDVVIIVRESNNEVVVKALSNLCCENCKSRTIEHHLNGICEMPPAAKLLGVNSSHPVIYLQRIFVLEYDNVELQFSEYLKDHLQHYERGSNYMKVLNIQVNGNTEGILEKLQMYKSIIQLEHFQGVLKAIISNQNFQHLVECEKLLRHELGDNIISSYEENDVLRRIYDSRERHIHQSIEGIKKCLSMYGPENVFLSFNGGKDCTVLLHLVHLVLRINYPDYKSPIFCLYVKSKEAFSEQDEFISQCQIFYNLDMMTVSLGMKEALDRVLKMKPNLKAGFMGTRRTDPFSADLKVFQMTDPDWPQVMRVNPILEWHYSDIWDYLLFYKVPYCKLYDMGFTSLGNATNTIRNPSLLYRDAKLMKDVYLPAYKMMNESEERSGRNVKT
ncbi:unnamed protein product [Phaedon cochleariae]|uniref:FAD synthase n=1 Tax=Phaedon cochleariae TaxID=80249 RepID=A0A9N9SJS2_PHACE|nr:unnamed protein product [Phaedon cochleariae]